MKKITADFIFPIHSEPVKNGVLVCDDSGKILDLLNPSELQYQLEEVEKHEGILCPGFVNTHCHLELSHLKDQLTAGKGLDHFLKEIETCRATSEEEIKEAANLADKEMTQNGIVAVGDICNRNHTFNIKLESRIKYHNFIEVFSFLPAKAELAFNRGKELHDEWINLSGEDKGVSITPHAPYSVSNELFHLIKLFSEKYSSILSIHNQENEDENLFFEKKQGTLIERLKHFGINTDFWQPTGKPSLESILPLLPQNNKILLVHNTISKEEDILFAKENRNNLNWCFCPKANLFIENKLPEFDLFIKNECSITLGTDSLASNWGLSILEELKVISQKAPNIPLKQLLRWATKNGAEFLGFNGLGTFEKGKRPGINLLTHINQDVLKLTDKTEVKPLLPI